MLSQVKVVISSRYYAASIQSCETTVATVDTDILEDIPSRVMSFQIKQKKKHKKLWKAVAVPVNGRLPWQKYKDASKISDSKFCLSLSTLAVILYTVLCR